MSRIQLIACDAVADQDRRVEFELMQNSGIGPLASTGFLPVERRERITIAALFLIRDSCASQCYETIIFRDVSAAMNCDGAVHELTRYKSLIEELMNRWLAANQRGVSEIGVRWVLRGKKDALWNAIRSYVEEKQRRRLEKGHLVVHRPRACLALFAAAEALGLAFVHGVQPYLYIERIEPRILEKLGFSASSVDANPDVYIRVPRDDESVFRAVVLKDGVPVCDVPQVWLDVAQHPSRGREQADLIWRKILAPALLAKEKR